MPRLSLACVGVRRLVPDNFIFGVLDYNINLRLGFLVGVLGFWACYKFWGQMVTDSAYVMFTVH